MRLIGIQALLGLLQQRISTKAEAHGTGSGIVFDTVGVSNAGVVGNADGVGSAASIGITSGRISAVGAAAGSGVSVNGVGVIAGLIASVGSAVSHGTSAVVGEIKGLTASIAQASSHGTASASSSSFGIASGIGSGAAQGILIGTNATAGSASGVGSSNFIGDSSTSAGVGSAVGVGNTTTTSMTIRVATGTSSGVGASSTISGAIKAGLGASTGIGTADAIDPAAAFLARTSGLDSTHITAYTDLINGLLSDGVWSKLDALYIFATQTSTTALLNLVSTNFTGISHGPPTFTVDRGFTGADASSSLYVDPQFNPTTATSPHFVTNSCHVSMWGVTNVISTAAGGLTCGASTGGTSNATDVVPRYTDNKAYFRINDGSPSAGFTNTGSSSVGHWIANRTGSSASAGYRNGALYGSPNTAAGTLLNSNFSILVETRSGVPSVGSGVQHAMASIGGGLTATDASNFYSRLRTYMTAVGVP